ncbi:MAG: hypothetical protein Q9219_002913 [cf. Caloplaca sp. 3 TL-2023]
MNPSLRFNLGVTPRYVPPDLSRMASAHHNPRRRLLIKETIHTTSSFSPSSHSLLGEHAPANLPLKKSSTFHSPTTPPSQDEDPIVNIPLLPRRAPTCPKALGDVVAAGEKRVQDLIGAVDRSLSGLEAFSTDSQETLRAEDLPAPRFLLDTHVAGSDRMDIDPLPSSASPHQSKQRLQRKHHSSDSGIASTVTGSEDSLTGFTAGMG